MQQLTNIRAILDQHSLKFSENAILLIVKASKQYQSNLGKQNNLIISEKRKQLEAVKTTATQLSSMLKKWYPYLEAEREDKTLSTLDRLIQNTNISLNYYKSKKFAGRRQLKSPSLKLFVQILILIYEEETGEKYIIEKSSSFGRERTSYNPHVYEFVKSILKYVAPDEDPGELMKMARRDPLPLDYIQKMKVNIDEDFRNERSRDQRRAVTLKKKLVKKGFQLIP